MRLDFSEIAKTRGAQGSYAFRENVELDEDVVIDGPVEGRLTARNTEELLIVDGEWRARMRLPCSRCLEEIVVPLSAPIQEEFGLPGRQYPGGAGPIEQDEPAEAAFAEGVLDLTELLRQQVLLALPVSPVCRPTCKGLCPECGQNFNEGRCDCTRRRDPSPWEKLRPLAERKGPGRREDR